jgi:RND family efflux transporter MFP subunit
MSKKRIIITTVFLVLLGSFSLFKKLRSNDHNFTVVSVKKGEIASYISASGEIKAEKDATLKFQSSGLLSWVGVKKGDLVAKGQAIASLDARELKKTLEKGMNDYMTKRWDFEQTQDDYKETKERHLLTDEIRRILDKSQYDLNKSVLDYEIANLTYRLATIHSPLAGVVVEITDPYPGVNIVSTTTKFRIVDPESLYFEARVDESDIAKIKTGDRAVIELDAFSEETFEGVVSKIDFEASATSGGGTVYKAWIAFPGRHNGFRLGMNGEADIHLNTINNALLVPLTALYEKEGKTHVWKVEVGRVKMVEVVVGQTNDESAQIISGLNENDLIVVSGLNLLEEGQKINLN